MVLWTSLARQRGVLRSVAGISPLSCTVLPPSLSMANKGHMTKLSGDLCLPMTGTGVAGDMQGKGSWQLGVLT